MDTIVSIYLAGVGITLIVSILIMALLRSHLERILVDLCGTTERARFWTVFSGIMVVIAPVIFAMSYEPQQGHSTIIEIGNQLKFGLVGLVITLVVLGVVIRGFIPPLPASPSSGATITKRYLKTRGKQEEASSEQPVPKSTEDQ
jgi:hypothetical protein